jgi:hypothetical protein
MNIMRLSCAAFVVALIPSVLPAQQPEDAQVIRQARGVDSNNVRYDTLIRYGPWDDRNYQLTKADLEVLAKNEEELADPIPAFFRVRMRKEWPELRTEGPAQYPRSALQIFRLLYTGYEIDGKFYDKAEIRDGRFFVPKEPANVVPAPESRFLSGEVRVTSPEGAAESAVKMSPVNPDIVIAGSNGPGPGQRMHYSSDGGASWTETTLPLGGTCCDPTVDWKSDGTIAHTATLGNCGFSGCAVWYYRSSDNGQTWTDLENVTTGDPRRELTTSGSDKEFLHVDKSSSSPFQDNVYLTWHDANVLQFARSTNDGNTWTTTSFSADPVGIGSDIVTDSNGRIYYFWPGTNTRQIHLKTSVDGGATFATGTTVVASTNAAFDFPIPSMETRRAWIYVSADADLSSGPFSGSIYAAWTDTTAAESSMAANNHARIQVAYSRDSGATWNVVTPHETADSNSVDRWNQWLAVDADGTVHVVFYDTRNDPSRADVDLYHSFSTDGAVTFSTPSRLTSEISPNISDSFEFGDYNGMDAVMGKAIAVFTDNRRESTGSGDSIDIYATSPEGDGGLSFGEDCIAHNISNLRLVSRGWWFWRTWRIVDGPMQLFYFGRNRSEGKETLDIIRQFEFSNTCYIGRPHASMQYLRAGTEVPSDDHGSRDCIRFNRPGIRIEPLSGGRWRLTDGTSSMLIFPNQTEAQQGVEVIKHYELGRQCFVGRPDASFTFWLRD